MERSGVNFDDVLAFVRVVDSGSFARAGERLGLAKSIISRRVARLEARLGARLLTRTTIGAQPTEVGAAYYARASAILADLEAAHETVAAAVSDIAGPIRLAAPLSFGVQHLAPAISEFMARYPRVEFDLAFDDRPVDLTGGGFDLAVRIGNLADSSLVARRLAPVRIVAVASPAYLALRGHPRHPDDLSAHDGLLYANASGQWRFRDGDDWIAVRVKGRLRADNGEMLAQAAAAGLGIAILPTFIASAGIESGALATVLPEFPLAETSLSAVMPPGRATTARVRALVEFLAARFGPEPSWDPCFRAGDAAVPARKP